MKPNAGHALTLLAAAALAGCAGEGDSICSTAFSENETFLLPTTTACPGCIDENLRDAIDGSGESAGSLVFNTNGTAPAGGNFWLDVMQGARFQPGGKVGAYLTLPAGTSSSITVKFATYRDGEKQEDITCSSDAGGCEVAGGTIDGGGAFAYYGGVTTLAFDQVQMMVALGGVAQRTAVLVHEVCAAQ